jgi:hypothetical protein
LSQIFQSKLILYGYAIIEATNDVVASKNVLLKTIDKVPFIQNACCNEREKHSPTLDYFKTENKDISTYTIYHIL